MPYKDILASGTICSNAKVNIGLNIIDKAENGYHLLESLIQEISLQDTINITIAQSDGDIIIKTAGIPIDCNNQANTCYKILSYIRKEYNIQNAITIELNKKIPIGAGLGGGSGNAAAILNFFNNKLNLKISTDKKNELCTKIGMDVPFFIKGSLQYAEKMGEITTELPNVFKDHYFLIITPPFSIATKWAYSKLNKNLPSNKMRYNLLALEEPLKWDLFRNDFEDVVIPRYPEIGVLKGRLLDSGAIYSSLSGSGSTVFGIYNNYDQAVIASKKIDHKKYHITVTSPIYR